jgi:hypothetical protein
MKHSSMLLFLSVFVFLCAWQQGLAIDFFFEPDTSLGDAADTIWVSGRIGTSDSMRGFTVYMAYDTNLIRLIHPVAPGSLIVEREGLNFGYFDHNYIPDVLEVYGTIMNPSVDFWAGPGELFRLQFELRQCGDAPITAPYPPFFVDSHGEFPTVTFHTGTVFICGQVPQPASGLVIQPEPPDSVILRWFPVTRDTLGHPLTAPPDYVIFRQQILPLETPPSIIATVADTFFADSIGQARECLYYVISRTVE